MVGVEKRARTAFRGQAGILGEGEAEGYMQTYNILVSP